LVGGGRVTVPTNANLAFYAIPGQGRSWKFVNAASFELRAVGADGEPGDLVRLGPKLTYCFRDLVHSNPGPYSPRHAVYPGCSQDPGVKRRTLGTSIGWSDVYPSDYHENWIDVSGLSGCYWFLHRADPANYLYESNELNNVGMRRIQLPPRHGRVGRC
jgi:hypothetical protein